jgi:transposase
LFREFWDYSDAGLAELHLNGWCSWAIRSRLEPIKAKARMVKTYLDNILTYFTHGISNAIAEGLNSKIQTVKSNARGYRSFFGCRNSVLLYYGGLEIAP